MKRLIGIIVLMIGIYATYYDLTEGTLPKNENEPASEATSTMIPFQEITVRPGDTVLSIIENLEGFPNEVSINKIVEDFILLNGIAPQDIQAGKSYKIPLYSSDEQL